VAALLSVQREKALAAGAKIEQFTSVPEAGSGSRLKKELRA